MRDLAARGLAFLREETVLCAAAVLALVSAVLVPPDAGYLDYIDWNTLTLLFALMAVMKGFQRAGVFVTLGNRLLRRTRTTRQMLLVLVLLPLVCSMVITNDVSLITFVPFGITVLEMARQQQLVVPLVIWQTVAANLGSMLTPMGNPQNLYLYARSGMGFFEMCGLMLPYVLLSAVCIVAGVALRRSVPVQAAPVAARPAGKKELGVCLAGFVLCLLAIAKQLPAPAVALVIGVYLLIADRPLLAQVDYSLLGTFAAFFVFIGNMGRVPQFQALIAAALADHVVPVAVLTSQVISNVPAALLLSGFTDQWRALLVGCNLGGLGTLIASMASLISYKQVAGQYPSLRKRYLILFTLLNLGFLALLYWI